MRASILRCSAYRRFRVNGYGLVPLYFSCPAKRCWATGGCFGSEAREKPIESSTLGGKVSLGDHESLKTVAQFMDEVKNSSGSPFPSEVKTMSDSTYKECRYVKSQPLTHSCNETNSFSLLSQKHHALRGNYTKLQYRVAGWESFSNLCLKACGEEGIGFNLLVTSLFPSTTTKPVKCCLYLHSELPRSAEPFKTLSSPASSGSSVALREPDGAKQEVETSVQVTLPKAAIDAFFEPIILPIPPNLRNLFQFSQSSLSGPKLSCSNSNGKSWHSYYLSLVELSENLHKHQTLPRHNLFNAHQCKMIELAFGFSSGRVIPGTEHTNRSFASSMDSDTSIFSSATVTQRRVVQEMFKVLKNVCFFKAVKDEFRCSLPVPCDLTEPRIESNPSAPETEETTSQNLKENGRRPFEELLRKAEVFMTKASSGDIHSLSPADREKCMKPLKEFLNPPLVEHKKDSTTSHTHAIDCVFILLYRYVLSQFWLLSSKEKASFFRITVTHPGLHYLSIPLACWYAALECDIFVMFSDTYLEVIRGKNEAINFLHESGLWDAWCSSNFFSFTREMRTLSHIARLPHSTSDFSSLNAVRELLQELEQQKCSTTKPQELILANETRINSLHRIISATKEFLPELQLLAFQLTVSWFSYFHSFFCVKVKTLEKAQLSQAHQQSSSGIPSTVMDAFHIQNAQHEMLSISSLIPTSDTVLNDENLKGNRDVFSLLWLFKDSAQDSLDILALWSMETLYIIASTSGASLFKKVQWLQVNPKNFKSCGTSVRKVVAVHATPVLFNLDSESAAIREKKWSTIFREMIPEMFFLLSSNLGKLMLHSLLEDLRNYPNRWNEHIEFQQRNTLLNLANPTTHNEAQESLRELLNLGTCAAIYCLVNQSALLSSSNKGNLDITDNKMKAELEENCSAMDRNALVFEKLKERIAASFFACFQRLSRGCWASPTLVFEMQQSSIASANYMIKIIEELKVSVDSATPTLATSDSPTSSKNLSDAFVLMHQNIFTEEVRLNIIQSVAHQSKIIGFAEEKMRIFSTNSPILRQWAFFLIKDELHEASRGSENLLWSRNLSWSILENQLITLVQEKVESESKLCPLQNEEGLNLLLEAIASFDSFFNPKELSVLLRLLSRLHARQGVFLTKARKGSGGAHPLSVIELLPESIAYEKNVQRQRDGVKKSSNSLPVSHDDASIDSSSKPSAKLSLKVVEAVLQRSIFHHLKALPCSVVLDAVFTGLINISDVRDAPISGLEAETDPSSENSTIATTSDVWPVDVCWGYFVRFVAGTVIMQHSSVLLADSSGWEHSQLFGDVLENYSLDMTINNSTRAASNYIRKVLRCCVQADVQEEALKESQPPSRQVEGSEEVSSENDASSQTLSSESSISPNTLPFYVVQCYCLSAYLHLLLACKEKVSCVISSGKKSNLAETVSAVYILLLDYSWKALRENERIFPDELLLCLSYTTKVVQDKLLHLVSSRKEVIDKDTRKFWWTQCSQNEKTVGDTNSSMENDTSCENSKEATAEHNFSSSTATAAALCLATQYLPAFSCIRVPDLPLCQESPSFSYGFASLITGENTTISSRLFVECCQKAASFYWPRIWKLVSQPARSVAEDCKGRGNVAISTNLVFSFHLMSIVGAPIEGTEIGVDAMIHRAANYHSNQVALRAGVCSRKGDYSLPFRSDKELISHICSLATAAAVLPYCARSSSLISQQIRLVKDLCSTAEVHRFLLVLRNWGEKVRESDFLHHNPAALPEMVCSDETMNEKTESRPEGQPRIRGTIAHNVAAPPLRSAWAALTRRLLDFEVEKSFIGSSEFVASTLLGEVLAASLQTGAVLHCTDTRLFRQVLAFLAFDEAELAAISIPLSVQLLHCWTRMTNACSLGMDERREYAIILHQKFYSVFPKCNFCDLGKENLEFSMTNLVHHLSQLLEALGGLCVADIVLWDILTGKVLNELAPVLRSFDAKWGTELERSLLLSLNFGRRNAGFCEATT